MTPAIVPWSMEATSCGSVASGSEELANIRTMDQWVSNSAAQPLDTWR